MIKIIIAMLCFVFSSHALSDSLSELSKCNQYSNEFSEVLAGNNNSVSTESVKSCISEVITQSPMFLLASNFVNKSGSEWALEKLTEHPLKESTIETSFEKSDSQTYIEKFLIYCFFLSLVFFAITAIREILDYNDNAHQQTSLMQSFSGTAKIFIIVVFLAPVGDSSIIAIAIGALFGASIYVIHLCLFLVTPIFTAIFIPSDLDRDYPAETIETAKSLISDDLSNLLKIKTAEFNLKSADVSYNVKTDFTGKILADSVQGTLNCYALVSSTSFENGKLRLPGSIQNARCYAALTNNAYFQNFGSIEAKESADVEFWIDNEAEVERIQEEERRYACVNRLDSRNKENKNPDCLDYRLNQVVSESGYAKMITDSLSIEEIEELKIKIIESRFNEVKTRIKTQNSQTFKKTIDSQIKTITNGGYVSLFFAYAKAGQYSLKTDEYLEYFKKNKITFNGYSESKSNSNLFLSGKSSTSAQSLLVPIEKPEFYVVSSTNNFKKSSYVDNLIPPSSFNCQGGISECHGIKEINIIELEKKTAELLNYSSKTYFALKATKSVLSINNQSLALAITVVGLIMKLALLVVSCTTYIMFIILATKSFSLYVYLLLISFNIIVVIVKYLSSIAFNTQNEASHSLKELIFNSIVEPVLFIALYVSAFWISISVVNLAIFMLNIELSSVIQHAIELKLDTIINLSMLLFCIVLIALVPGILAKQLSNQILKKYEVRAMSETDNQIEGFYGEGKNYAQKLMRKIL